MKKVLTLLLVCSLMAALCINSFATETSYTDDGYCYEKTENGIMITGYRGTSETLSIPVTIGEDKVTAIGKKAFAGNENIKVVTIPQYVTTIEEGAFNDCTGIVTINISATNLNGCSEEGTFNRAGTENGHSGIGVNIGKAVSIIPDYIFYAKTKSASANIEGVNVVGYKSSGGPENVGTINPYRPEGIVIGKKAFGNSPIENMSFAEEAPKFIAEDAFENAELTVTYQETEPTWKTFEKKNYGGKITWEAAAFDWASSEEAPLFEDVPDNAYYKDAVLWAIDNNVTAGTGNRRFSPDSECNRAQVVTFLWRANGSPKPKSSTNPFVDIKTNDYYYDAVLWAIEKGITVGTSKNTFSPNAPCTRGQIVTFLWRSEGSPKTTLNKNPFADIAKDEFLCQPVLWAYENEITSGTSKTTFSSNVTCTRAQTITFIYKAHNN